MKWRWGEGGSQVRYVTQQSAREVIGVVNGRDDGVRISEGFLEAVNMVLDELLWGVIGQLGGEGEIGLGLSDGVGSGGLRGSGVVGMRSGGNGMEVKPRLIQGVIPSKLAREAIIEAELGVMSYDSICAGSSDSEDGSGSGPGCLISTGELFEQVQIDCQILITNLVHRIQHPTSSRASPGSGSGSDPPAWHGSMIGLLVDQNRFEVLLHAHYHNRHQAWFSHPGRDREGGRQGEGSREGQGDRDRDQQRQRPRERHQLHRLRLARTILDHHSIIYLVAFLRSLASYLINGSIDLISSTRLHSTRNYKHQLWLLADHLLQFIANDEPMTGFYAVFDQLEAKQRIQAIQHPRLDSSDSSSTSADDSFESHNPSHPSTHPINHSHHTLPLPLPEPIPNHPRWRDNIQPSWLNTNPVTSPPAPFSLSLKRDHSPRRSVSSKNKSAQTSPRLPLNGSLNSLPSSHSPKSPPILHSPALLPRQRTSSKKSIASTRSPALHTPPSRLPSSSYANPRSPRDPLVDPLSLPDRHLGRVTNPNRSPFSLPISPPLVNHHLYSPPHSAPVPSLPAELIYNLSHQSGCLAATLAQPRLPVGRPVPNPESRSLSSASSASSASIISAPTTTIATTTTTTSHPIPDWNLYPAHAHPLDPTPPANAASRSRSWSTSSVRPSGSSVGKEHLPGSLTSIHSGSSTSSPYNSSRDRSLLSPPPPTHLSFEELMLSNQTMKVSLTPGQCLESDSAMMSRQSSTSTSELPLLASHSSEPHLSSTPLPPVARLEPRTEPSPQHHHNNPAVPNQAGSVNELVARNKQRVRYEADEECDEDSDLDEFQEARNKRKSRQLQTLAEILRSDPPWAAQEDKSRVRPTPAPPQGLPPAPRGRLGSAAAFMKKKAPALDVRSGRPGPATLPIGLSMFGAFSGDSRSSAHDRAGPSSDPMDEYMSHPRRFAGQSPSPSDGSLVDLRKHSVSSDSDHVAEPFSPGLSVGSDDAPHGGSAKEKKKTRGFKSIIARLKGKDDQDGSSPASLPGSRESKSDQSSCTHEGGPPSLASSSTESMLLGVRGRGLLTKDGVLHNPHSPAIGPPPELPQPRRETAPPELSAAPREVQPHQARQGGANVTRGRTLSSVTRQAHVPAPGPSAAAGPMPVSVGTRPPFMSFVVDESGPEGDRPRVARTLPIRRSSSMKSMAYRPMAPPLGPLLDVVGYSTIEEDGGRRETKMRTLTGESNSSEASAHTITRFEGHHHEAGSPKSELRTVTGSQVGRIVDEYDKGAGEFSVRSDMAARRVAIESFGVAQVDGESAAVVCRGEEEEDWDDGGGGEDEEEGQEEEVEDEELEDLEDGYGRRARVTESVMLEEVYQIEVAREIRPAMVSRMVLGSHSSTGSVLALAKVQQAGERGWVSVEEVRGMVERVTEKVEKLLRDAERLAPGSRGTFGSMGATSSEGGTSPSTAAAVPGSSSGQGTIGAAKRWERLEKREVLRVLEEEVEKLKRSN